MLKHVFFDLDGTLTRSHALINPAHVAPLLTLCEQKDVIVVTGGKAEDIKRQLTPPLDGKYFSLAQSGGHAIDKGGTELWFEKLSREQTSVILELVEKLKRGFNVPVKDEADCVELRGAQVGYSVLGYNEDVDKKYAFDPGFGRRKAMLAKFPEDVERLRSVGIEVAVAGTTTFNFTLIGQDKGSNVRRLIEREDWNRDDCLYIGDALGPGENDYAVVGVIETHLVKDENDTSEFIANTLLA